jgi:hypothetical protein
MGNTNMGCFVSIVKYYKYDREIQVGLYGITDQIMRHSSAILL